MLSPKDHALGSEGLREGCGPPRTPTHKHVSRRAPHPPPCQGLGPNAGHPLLGLVCPEQLALRLCPLGRWKVCPAAEKKTDCHSGPPRDAPPASDWVSLTAQRLPLILLRPEPKSVHEHPPKINSLSLSPRPFLCT